MKKFTSLAYRSADELVFGRARRPVRCGFDLLTGGGQVYPEINFTLPPMKVDAAHLRAIVHQYEEMIDGIVGRLLALGVPGAMIEFEHAPQMTEEIEIGVAVTAAIKKRLQDAYSRDGLRTALRVTVCDIREKVRPPRIRTGAAAELVIGAFHRNAGAGADLLAIESTGGKEVSDRALMEADIPGLLLALGVLAPRDSRWLWQQIAAIAAGRNIVPSGDTACAFANTAMVLADQKYIPNVLAAVVRAMAAVRTLVAHEAGAVGPTKDCAYEGPIIKAITGCPVSLEGKAAACAHFSHMGNIAMATCDLWSNESVQNVKLLAGFAPEVFTEILAYDCRLLNQALATNSEMALRQLLIDSDVHRSVHALVISPQASFAIAEAIVAHGSDFDRTRAAGQTACRLIRDAVAAGAMVLPAREQAWLEQIEEELAKFDSEASVIDDTAERFGELYLAGEYGL